MFLKNKLCPIRMIVELLKKRSKRAPLTIQIETTNCRRREFHHPILVKDVLAEYPSHAIFAYDNRSTPLKGSELLQPGNIYFLSRRPRRQKSSDRLGRTKSGEDGGGSRHVSFASTPSYIEPWGSGGEKDRNARKAGKILTGGSDENVTRVKLLLTKDEYKQLLRDGGEAVMKKVLKPLLEELRLPRSQSAPHLSPALTFSS